MGKDVLDSNKDRVLALIRDCEDYISGQEICEKLDVSRTAVWKNINLLKEEGYVIEAVRNKGYRLVMNTTQLSRAEISLGLNTREIGHKLVVAGELDSTNNEVRRMAEQGAENGLLMVSDSQTAGKGRRGRKWTSPRGSNIYMSLLLRPRFLPDRASMLTLVAAMAVREAILSVTGVSTRIKWPNDLVHEGKKVCGILTEMSAEADYINYVVIGIGINVNIREFPEEIRKTATSLLLETGKNVDRNKIISAFCNSFEGKYGLFTEMEDMTLLLDEYNENLVNNGRGVRIIEPSGEYEGVSEGIDREGKLAVRKEDGTVTRVLSGEVSVRGVYGYV